MIAGQRLLSMTVMLAAVGGATLSSATADDCRVQFIWEKGGACAVEKDECCQGIWPSGPDEIEIVAPSASGCVRGGETVSGAFFIFDGNQHCGEESGGQCGYCLGWVLPDGTIDIYNGDLDGGSAKTAGITNLHVNASEYVTVTSNGSWVTVTAMKPLPEGTGTIPLTFSATVSYTCHDRPCVDGTISYDGDTLQSRKISWRATLVAGPSCNDGSCSNGNMASGVVNMSGWGPWQPICGDPQTWYSDPSDYSFDIKLPGLPLLHQGTPWWTEVSRDINLESCSATVTVEDQRDGKRYTLTARGRPAHHGACEPNVYWEAYPAFDTCTLGGAALVGGPADGYHSPFGPIWRSGPDGGTRIEYVYDPRLSSAAGATLWYSYDENGRVTQQSVGPSDQRTPFLTLAYSADGLVTHRSGGCGSCGVPAVDYAYDSNQKVTKTTDAYGNVTELKEYDYSMIPPEVTKLSAISSNGQVFTRSTYQYDYDAQGQTYQSMTKRSFVTNGQARVEINEYDERAYNGPTKILQFSGLGGTGDSCSRTRFTSYTQGTRTASYEISPLGVTQKSIYGTTAGSPSFGQVVEQVIESADHVTMSHSRSAYQNIQLTDAWSQPRVTMEIDARGLTREYEYGSQVIPESLEEGAPRPFTLRGLLKRQSEHADGFNGQTHQYAYDSGGRVTLQWSKSTSGGDVSTAFAYDHHDNLTRAIEGYGTATAQTSRYWYDFVGNQTREQSPAGNERIRRYTAGGVVTSEYVLADLTSPGDNTDPLTRTNALSQTRYEYDANGRVTRQMVADAESAFAIDSPTGWITTRYIYDGLGRKTEVIEDEGNGAGQLNLVTRYEYNNQDELVKTTTPGGVFTRVLRDGRGLQTMQIVGFEGSMPDQQMTTQYAYDADGNVTSMTTPAGAVTTYEYDGFGRRTEITEN